MNVENNIYIRKQNKSCNLIQYTHYFWLLIKWLQTQHVENGYRLKYQFF